MIKKYDSTVCDNCGKEVQNKETYGGHVLSGWYHLGHRQGQNFKNFDFCGVLCLSEWVKKEKEWKQLNVGCFTDEQF